MNELLNNVEVDILVVGAGACGLTAAIVADQAGANVAIVEQAVSIGGNTALSSGSIPAAGTRLQRQKGIEDHAHIFEQDLQQMTASHDASEVASMLAHLSSQLIDWLTDEVGVKLTLIDAYKHVGHSITRLHGPPSRQGSQLLSDLAAETTRRGIPIAFETSLVDLIANDGAVVGAALIGRDQRVTTVTAAKTVLACNGFGASEALKATHISGSGNLLYFGAPSSDGTALRTATPLGAALGNMQAYQGHASVSTKLQSLVTWTVVERGGMIIDASGRRIGNETTGYSAFAAIEASGDAPFHLIFDAEICESVRQGQTDFGEIISMGASYCQDSFETLCHVIDVPPDESTRTLTNATSAARGDQTDEFGRLDWGKGPLRPPYHAIEISPALFHTQGGLRVNTQAQVLREDGSVICGLYAGGGAAVGISGKSGPEGYVSGNGLLSACGLGYVAGRHAANALLENYSDIRTT